MHMGTWTAIQGRHDLHGAVGAARFLAGCEKPKAVLPEQVARRSPGRDVLGAVCHGISVAWPEASAGSQPYPRAPPGGSSHDFALIGKRVRFLWHTKRATVD